MPAHHHVLGCDCADGIGLDALEHHEVGEDGREEDDPIAEAGDEGEGSVAHDGMVDAYGVGCSRCEEGPSSHAQHARPRATTMATNAGSR